MSFGRRPTPAARRGRVGSDALTLAARGQGRHAGRIAVCMSRGNFTPERSRHGAGSTAASTGLASLVNETIAWPGSSAVLQLLGLATGTSALLSRLTSWAALVTA